MIFRSSIIFTTQVQIRNQTRNSSPNTNLFSTLTLNTMEPENFNLFYIPELSIKILTIHNTISKNSKTTVLY